MAVLKIKDADGKWVKVGIGAQGSPGSDGVSIVSIDRTSGNGAAGTTDTYTITMSDGSTSTFSVYNGADGTMTFEDLTEEQKESLRGPQGIQGPQGEKGDKGDTGATGAAGYTPVKGVDYWTEEDKAEIAKNLLPLSGGTMTGPLTLSGDPTEALHAASKQYIDTGTLKVHRMNRYINAAGWYRIGRFTLGSKNDMFPTAVSPYSEIVRIYIHGNVNNGSPYPFMVDAYLMWNAGGMLRQQPAYQEPYAVTQVRICNVTGDHLSYDIDVYYPHSVGNDVRIAVQPLSSTFVSSALAPVTEMTGTATRTLTLTKDGFLGEIDPNWLTAPVPIEKGGLGVASVEDARSALNVPSNEEMNTAISNAIGDINTILDEINGESV